MVDQYFEQAVKNIDYFMSKCSAKLLINGCSYSNHWTVRFGGKVPWYTFKLIDARIQEVTFEISLPATEDFNDDNIIYRDEFKWTVNKLLITDDYIISRLEDQIEKCNDDKSQSEDWLDKYKLSIDKDRCI